MDLRPGDRVVTTTDLKYGGGQSMVPAGTEGVVTLHSENTGTYYVTFEGHAEDNPFWIIHRPGVVEMVRKVGE